MPLITLALRTSDGQWEWLTDQAIGTDGEFIYISGKASHTSTLMGFGGTDFAQYDWTPADLQVPVGGTFALNGTVTAPLDAPTPPVVSALGDLQRYAERFLAREPFTHTGVLSGQGEVFNSTDWDNLSAAQGGNAMPRIYQEFECVQPGQWFTPIGYEVIGLGAGSQLYERLDLGPPSTTLLVGGHLICIEGTGADIVTPTSGCLIVVHTARGTFISYLRLLLGFGRWLPEEILRVEVTIEGANDGEAAIGELTGDNIYEVLLGLRGSGPKTLKQALVTDPDGMMHDVTPAVAELLGGTTWHVPFPAEPIFGTCPKR